MEGETWVYNLASRLSAPKAYPISTGAAPMQIGQFGFFFGDSGNFNDATIVDTSTMTLLTISPEEWLQDPRNYPPQLGFDAGAIRTMLSSYAAEAGAAIQGGHSGTAPGEGHEATLGTHSIPGETVVLPLDVASVFEAAPAAEEHVGPVDTLFTGGHATLHPPIDALHIAIA